MTVTMLNMTNHHFDYLRRCIIQTGELTKKGVWADSIGNYYYKSPITEYLIWNGVEYARDTRGNIEATPIRRTNS